MARALRLLSGQFEAAQESAGARLQPHKVMKVAGHARGPGIAEQGGSCACAHRGPRPVLLGSNGQCAASLLPPPRDPQVAISPQPAAPAKQGTRPGGRKAGTVDARQVAPLLQPPFQMVLVPAPPEPLGLGVDGSLCRQAQVGAPPPSLVSLGSAHSFDSPGPTFGCHPLPGNRRTPQTQCGCPSKTTHGQGSHQVGGVGLKLSIKTTTSTVTKD